MMKLQRQIIPQTTCIGFTIIISFCISGTPSPGDDLEKQRPKRKRSAQDTKRRLALEMFEKKRREGSVKKKLPPEENVFSEITPNYDASPDSCQHVYTSQLISVSDNKSDKEDLEEGQSSQSEEDMTDFIVSDNLGSEEGMDPLEKPSEKDHATYLWNPSSKDAFKVLVQNILTRLLMPEDVVSVEDSDPYFEKAKQIIEKELGGRKSLVTSNVWSQDFLKLLSENHVLEQRFLAGAETAKCQACQRKRKITRVISLQNEEGETVKDFRVGQFCAAQGVLFHRIHHYISVELKKRCEEKLPHLEQIAQMDSNRSITDVVSTYCEEQKEEWLKELYTKYKDMIRKADEWTTEGKEYQRMKSSVSSFRH
ncbi:uncharacterized protein [Montipora capricornis]|uniref:uncharacterized protein n=1 Tax=Montipora capricornis TaxID=246305 RepID=UPI0035F10D7E